MAIGRNGERNISWPGILYAVKPDRMISGVRCTDCSRATLHSFMQIIHDPHVQNALQNGLLYPREEDETYHEGEIVIDDADNRDCLFEICQRRLPSRTLIVPNIEHITAGWCNANPGWFGAAYARDPIPVIDAEGCYGIIKRALDNRDHVHPYELARRMRAKIMRDGEKVQKFVEITLGRQLLSEIADLGERGMEYRGRNLPIISNRLRPDNRIGR